MSTDFQGLFPRSIVIGSELCSHGGIHLSEVRLSPFPTGLEELQSDSDWEWCNFGYGNSANFSRAGSTSRTFMISLDPFSTSHFKSLDLIFPRTFPRTTEKMILVAFLFLRIWKQMPACLRLLITTTLTKNSSWKQLHKAACGPFLSYGRGRK